MKRFVMVLIGGIGAGAFWRRKAHQESLTSTVDPAAELRARLDAAKDVPDEPVADAPAEQMEESATEATSTVPESTAVSQRDPDARRAAIQERAREAIDELR